MHNYCKCRKCNKNIKSLIEKTTRLEKQLFVTNRRLMVVEKQLSKDLPKSDVSDLFKPPRIYGESIK